METKPSNMMTKLNKSDISLWTTMEQDYRTELNEEHK